MLVDAALCAIAIGAHIFNRRGGKEPLSRCVNANPDAKFFAGIQTSKNNFEYGAFATAAMFAATYIKCAFSDGCHVDELIRPNVAVKLFVDVDSHSGPVDVEEVMDIMGDHATQLGFNINRSKVLVDTSHGDGKHSYHIVYNGPERFESMAHLKAFMIGIAGKLQPYGVDMGVYEKNHMFRLHGSSRHGSTRFMGDPSDVTRKKNGQPNAQYRKFIEDRLITNTSGHRSTICGIEVAADVKTEQKTEQPTQRFEIDVMEEFQNYPESAAWLSEAVIVDRPDGVEYRLTRVAPSFCTGCDRVHDSRLVGRI
jgi:hypothetical protein